MSTETHTLCRHCSSPVPVRICYVSSKYVCASCGYIDEFREKLIQYTDYADNRVLTSNAAYERVNFFRDKLRLLLWQESHVVQEQDILKIAQELYIRWGITRTRDITIPTMMRCMKRMRVSKLYKHYVQVYCRLTNSSPPRVSHQEFASMVSAFLDLQVPWESCKSRRRINFLSYPYCLYRLCEYISRPDLLHWIVLLQDVSKLKCQDTMFFSMTDSINWNRTLFAPIVLLSAPPTSTHRSVQ